MPPPTGEQLVLASGRLTAVVTEVGATLRSYRCGDEPVLWEFAEGEFSSGGRGQVLAPWPNRLEDGQYSFDGTTAAAPLDEPARSNAIHGLVRWLRWRIEARTASSATLSCSLFPQPAYPFALDLVVDYRLGIDGLQVTFTASTPGPGRAPFGIGFHPYLAGPPGGIDGARLDLAATTHLRCSDRGLPIATEAVAASGLGLQARPLTGLVLDDCFGGLRDDGDGRWRATLASGDRSVTMWADAAFEYVMCYTGDTLADGADRRRAVAVEPMTCPPNALRTGTGIIVLEPGTPRSASWGIGVPTITGS